MNQNWELHCLRVKWVDYLQQRGHRICQTAINNNIIKSSNHIKTKYRWLLYISDCCEHKFNSAEKALIRRYVKQAGAQKESIYLVIGFTQEPRRVVILPADAAVKAGCVSSDKGGIAWDD